MQGRRRPVNADGFYTGSAQPGDFGRIERSLEQVLGYERQLWWLVTAPDGSGCSLNPAIHTVIEHSDGSISVTPSIVTRTWHGYLEAGIWRAI